MPFLLLIKIFKFPQSQALNSNTAKIIIPAVSGARPFEEASIVNTPANISPTIRALNFKRAMTVSFIEPLCEWG